MSRSLARVRVFGPILILVPLFLSSGCSFLPSREKVSAKVGEVRDVTEAKLREKWSTEWKPALKDEVVSLGKDLAAEVGPAVRDLLRSQAESYRADLEAKIADGKASTGERIAYWILGALGLLGTGKGVQQGGKLKAMLTAIVTAVEVAVRDGKTPDLKAIIKTEATRLGVDALLYPLVQTIAAKLKT